MINKFLLKALGMTAISTAYSHAKKAWAKTDKAGMV